MPGWACPVQTLLDLPALTGCLGAALLLDAARGLLACPLILLEQLHVPAADLNQGLPALH